MKTRLKVIQGKGLGLFAVDDVRPGALIHEYVEERDTERKGVEREREREREGVEREREGVERKKEGVEKETGREKGVRKVERREREAHSRDTVCACLYCDNVSSCNDQ